MKCKDGEHSESLQMNIEDDAAEKFLYQILFVGTICRQHLAYKIPMKWLTQEQ